MPRTEEPTGESEDRIDEVALIPPGDVPERLERLEELSGGWLNDRADLFNLHEWDSVDEYEIRRKAFAEGALYLMLGDHLDVEPAAERSALHDVVVEQSNTRLYEHGIRRNQVEVRSYGYPALYTKHAGLLENDAVWEALGDVLGEDYVWARERQPFALLDVWHIAQLYGADSPFEPGEILRTSSMAMGLHPIRCTLKDIYALTHDVMFYTGFGMDGFGFLEEPAPYDASLEHKALVLRFLADHKYDALGELLLTGVLQHEIPPDLVGVALHRIVAEAEVAGFVPDYTLDDDTVDTISQSNVEALEHLDKRAEEWGAQYHANIVAGYAGLGIRAEWPALLDAFESRGNPTYDPENLLGLGQALNKLSNYDLKGAARTLREVAGTDAAAAYPDVFDLAVSFLREQHRNDGEFGYWPEEEMRFSQLGYDAGMFQDKLVTPSTEACQEALDDIEERE